MTLRTHTKNSEGRQHVLFHEDINSAIQGLVSVLGGAKVVGSRLYPDKGTDAAARRVLDSLNADREQNFSQSQFVTLLRWGREAGFHGLMEYLCAETGYAKPVPTCPEDEKAELQKKFIDAVGQVARLAEILKVRV